MEEANLARIEADQIMTNSNPCLILASGSPRRHELLRQAGFDFGIISLESDENFPKEIPEGEVAEFLAKKKNQLARLSLQDEIIITADTVVILDGQILGKPDSLVEAKEMLSKLSGKSHEVITGVCISSIDNCFSFSDKTEVVFAQLSIDEIDYYVERYQPLDKAGAYGIQEWIGLIGVKEIRGSYYNVVGLPVQRLFTVLVRNFDVNWSLR